MRFDELIAQCGLPRAEARVLLEHAGGHSREWLIAHGDELAPDTVRACFTELVDARCIGEPLAYLLGWREFHGHRFIVSPQVLIPRPETEMLVDRVVAAAPPNGTVIDLGTGSGCIAISIAIARPDLTVTALDVSAAALAIAEKNARALCPQTFQRKRLQLLQSDWWSAVDAAQRFDMVVANPPYIVAGDRHLREGDLRHEPIDALTDHGDGLQAIKSIIETASAHIQAGGLLLIEHGYDQAKAVRQLASRAGLSQVFTLRDAAGLDRVTLGKYDVHADSPKKAENRQSH